MKLWTSAEEGKLRIFRDGIKSINMKAVYTVCSNYFLRECFQKRWACDSVLSRDRHQICWEPEQHKGSQRWFIVSFCPLPHFFRQIPDSASLVWGCKSYTTTAPILIFRIWIQTITLTLLTLKLLELDQTTIPPPHRSSLNTFCRGEAELEGTENLRDMKSGEKN